MTLIAIVIGLLVGCLAIRVGAPHRGRHVRGSHRHMWEFLGEEPDGSANTIDRWRCSGCGARW